MSDLWKSTMIMDYLRGHLALSAVEWLTHKPKQRLLYTEMFEITMHLPAGEPLGMTRAEFDALSKSCWHYVDGAFNFNGRRVVIVEW